MSRYLVTGPTGFLGRHLVHLLVEGGHTVVALCRKASPDLEAQGLVVEVGDILDGASVRRAAEGCAGVFHCAGMVSRKRADAEILYRVNVDGTKTVLDASQQAGVRRVVLASTSGTVAVSKSPEVLDERSETPVDILSGWPYYRSKLYAERAALDRNTKEFEVVSINPSLLLGPGDVNGTSTGDVVQFLEGKLPVIPAGGLSFVDARDAALAMVLGMEKGRGGQRYLVGAANMTLFTFFRRVARIAEVKEPILKAPKSVWLAKLGADLLERVSKHVPVDFELDPVSAEMGQYFWYLDNGKAKRELGWDHRDPLETLSDTVEDLRLRGVVWPK